MIRNFNPIRLSLLKRKKEAYSDGSISPRSSSGPDFSSFSFGSSCAAESLEGTLADKRGRKLFREFLRSQYCTEVLQFYEAVEDFENYLRKKLKIERRPSFDPAAIRSDSWPSITLKSSVGKKINKKANDIFTKYISFDASCPLNINSGQRKHIARILEKCEEEKRCVPLSIYSELLEEIFVSMKVDNWPKFIQTDVYETWKSSLK
eukprot:gb/GECH01004275.1/.p1 GENE.gb/GECH01004275.1/~~gb/GECH01004275.1/.p1  ORF type:complete len:206 (+),score=51.94 gb/GECH01004275.1/:1-618(+)